MPVERKGFPRDPCDWMEIMKNPQALIDRLTALVSEIEPGESGEGMLASGMALVCKTTGAAAAFCLESESGSDPRTIFKWRRDDSTDLEEQVTTVAAAMTVIASAGRLLTSPSNLLSEAPGGEDAPAPRNAGRDDSQTLSREKPPSILGDLEGNRNVIIIPCRMAGEVTILFCFVDLESFFLSNFTNRAELKAFAGKLSGTLINLRLHDRWTEGMWKDRQVVELVSGIGMILNSSLELPALVRLVAGKVSALLDAEGCSVIIADEESGCLNFFAVNGQLSEIIEKLSIPIDTGVAGWVYKNGRHHISNDAQKDVKFNAFVDLVTDFCTRNILAVPLKSNNKIIGVVEAVNKKSPGGFTEEDADLLYSMSFQLALVIMNITMMERMSRASKKKQLTLEAREREIVELKNSVKSLQAELLKAKSEAAAADGSLKASQKMAQAALRESESLTSETARNIEALEFRAETAEKRAAAAESGMSELAGSNMAMSNALAELNHNYQGAIGKITSLEARLSELREIQSGLAPGANLNGEIQRFAKYLGYLTGTCLHRVIGCLENTSLLTRGEGGKTFKERNEIYGDLDGNISICRRIMTIAHDLCQCFSGLGPGEAFQQVDLNRIVIDEIERAAPLAAKRGITVRFAPSGPRPLKVSGIPESLSNMVSIILDNALKYTSEPYVMQIVSEKGPGSAVLRFADKGIGIHPEYHELIFERFFRIPGSEQFAEGLGLGLHVARYIARAHNGNINLTSTPGSGTIMEVTLPMGR